MNGIFMIRCKMDTTLRYNYNIKQEKNIMRLFIAIELEPNIMNALLEIQGNMIHPYILDMFLC